MTAPAPVGAQAAPAQPKKKSPLGGILFLVAFVGGLIALAFFYRDLFGSEVGGACTAESDCKRDGICISKKCYRKCKEDADCGKGNACGSTEVSVTPGGNAAKGFSFEHVNVCFTEEQMAPARAKTEQKKKQTVRGLVDAAFGMRPDKMPAATFDAAWQKIPEEERRKGDNTDLANRVMRIAAGKE